MKKLLLILVSVLSLPLSAQQKITLLEPRIGEGSTTVSGMEKRMVQGELRKAVVNFSGYEAITRSDIDQMMQEQNFQRTGMVSEAQIKKLGEMSGADYICVSTLTKSDTEFYLEAYLVHLESGRMLSPASQYGELINGKFANLFPACKALANELLSSHVSSDYVDLGLPSRTLWKDKNENCGLISYDRAFDKYGNTLPTKEQWEELTTNCHWTWTGNGYKVKGQNGNFILLPAEGFSDCDGYTEKDLVGTVGYYWSFTLYVEDATYAWGLPFGSNEIGLPGLGGIPRCYGQSVRLVKR